jgi:drug/metabolite transporter (DMT)-like permease
VVLVPILSGLFFRQKISTVVWVAVSMSTVGLGLIALNGLHIGSGEVFTLMCAFLFALHVIGLDRWADPEYVYSLTTTQIGTVFLTSVLASAITGDFAVPQGTQTWLNIVLLAVVATCIGYFAQTWVQSQLSSTRTAIILTMEPVFAGIAGVLLGNDKLTLRIVLGSLLILAATYVVELGPRHSAEGEHIHLEP